MRPPGSLKSSRGRLRVVELEEAARMAALLLCQPGTVEVLRPELVERLRRRLDAA